MYFGLAHLNCLITLCNVYFSIFVVFFDKCLLNEMYATKIMYSVTKDNFS